jgi:lipopolysaccharide-induced tumor necrosis factor-alpha factor
MLITPSAPEQQTMQYAPPPYAPQTQAYQSQPATYQPQPAAYQPPQYAAPPGNYATGPYQQPPPGYVQPGPYGYAPGPQAVATNNTNVTHETKIVVMAAAAPEEDSGPIILGDSPVQIKCPNCHNRVATRILHVAGTLTYTWCLVLLLVGGPLFIIPLCTPSCDDTKHFCPVCSRYMGTKKNSC